MGGLLALALALRRQDDLAGLALLATPWDFHAGQGGQGRLVAASLAAFSRPLELLGELPVDPIQGLFAALDPIQVIRKFLAFSRLDPASARAEAFVALEDWLNDGVPLAAPVARECLAGWYGANTTAEGRWQVAGRIVAPAELALPSLCLIPAQDRIVPPESAIALADAIPGAARMTPPAGHIGMVASASAPSKVWRPLARWLAARAGS
jgi:polyhydroxyalkanoate synthase